MGAANWEFSSCRWLRPKILELLVLMLYLTLAGPSLDLDQKQDIYFDTHGVPKHDFGDCVAIAVVLGALGTLALGKFD